MRIPRLPYEQFFQLIFEEHHMTVKPEDLDRIFTFQDNPTAEQKDAYLEIRARGLDLAAAILRGTPVCGDQQAAIRKVREAVMTANAAVALKGAV